MQSCHHSRIIGNSTHSSYHTPLLSIVYWLLALTVGDVQYVVFLLWPKGHRTEIPHQIRKQCIHYLGHSFLFLLPIDVCTLGRNLRGISDMKKIINRKRILTAINGSFFVLSFSSHIYMSDTAHVVSSPQFLIIIYHYCCKQVLFCPITRGCSQ